MKKEIMMLALAADQLAYDLGRESKVRSGIRVASAQVNTLYNLKAARKTIEAALDIYDAKVTLALREFAPAIARDK